MVSTKSIVGYQCERLTITCFCPIGWISEKKLRAQEHKKNNESVSKNKKTVYHRPLNARITSIYITLSRSTFHIRKIENDPKQTSKNTSKVTLKTQNPHHTDEGLLFLQAYSNYNCNDS